MPTVEDVLRADFTMSDDLRGDLWDAYQAAPTHDALAEILRPVPIADTTKEALIRAKFDSLALYQRAMFTMKNMDRDQLDRAEAYPNVFRALVALHSARTK
jgi:hypothetical protein